MTSTSTKRAPKLNAHVVAFNKFRREGVSYEPAAIEILEVSTDAAAITTLTIAEPAALVPFDAEAFERSGTMSPLTDAEFETLMTAHLEGDDSALDSLEAAEDAPELIEDTSEELPLVDNRSYRERLVAVTDEQRGEMVWDLAFRIDSRIETAERDAPISVKNLKRARAKMVQGRVATCLAACGLEGADFVNREYHQGSEFNVYGLFKIPDIAAGLAGGVITNAINIALIKSMFALERAGISFDFETAKATSSSEYNIDRPGVRSHLTRHTVKRGTASTQAGSTLHALAALGIVSLGRGKNYPVTILQNATTEALRNAKFAEEAGDE